MSRGSDRAREELIRAKILRPLAQQHRERGLAEVLRRVRVLEGEPEKPLPDVPLHKRGFGVMDEDTP